VTRYEDVVTILKDPRFSNEYRAGTQPNPFAAWWMPRVFRALQTGMLRNDDPNHTRLRSLVHLAFTPKRVEALTAQIEQITQTLLNEVAQKQAVDLIADFALPLPLAVISEMMGIPEQDRSRFRQLFATFGGLVSGKLFDIALSIRAAYQIMSFLTQLLRLRRAEPQEDMITALVNAEQEGDRLTEDELLAMILELFLAGHETTINLIGNGALALLEYPDQLRLLHQNPDLIERAVEEFLRYTCPVEIGTMRYPREAMELHGVTLSRGSVVIPLFTSANRDETVFENPGQVDITRDPNRHLAFGGGGHYCLGAPLARLEGQIALRTLTQRFPGLKLAVSHDQVQWNNTFLGLHGLKALPVTLA
jgi:cytochrome P450 PksS